MLKDTTDKKAVQVEAQQKYRDILKLAAFISNNPRMNMEAAAARVIEAINHVPIRIQEGDGKFNMCEAIEEMIKDGKQDVKWDVRRGRIELIN